MKKILLTLCLGSIAAAFLSPAAYSVRGQSRLSPFCDDAAALAAQLSAGYREKPVAHGVTAGGRMLQVFVSKGGTWTIVVVLPDGRACVVSHGDGWQRAPADSEGPAGRPS